MIIQPIHPIVSPPVINPIFQQFVAENVIAWDAVLLIIKMILVATAALVIGLLLNRNMEKQGFVTNKTFTLIASTVMAPSLTIDALYELTSYFPSVLHVHADAVTHKTVKI